MTINTGRTPRSGISAIDLREGTADRLPGRRGAGLDHSVFPQTFAAFAHALHPGIPASPRERIAEIVSDAGYESPTSRLEGFDAPAELHVWQTRRAGEIDFVCGSRSAPDLVEVKYQSSPDLRRVAAIPRAFPGRPVLVATKHRLERRGSYALVPAALLLWALG